jgi:hypothetical protein
VKRGGAGSFLVTPVPIEHRAPTFTVAGCSGYRLGSLRRTAA